MSISPHEPATGTSLLRAVAIMDQLRSPGGCPWDAEQTHDSLLRYLVEECYELVQAIEDGDDEAIREELGDVLLQVLFHARVAAERSPDDGGFTIDEVAEGLVAKLIRRHPHVFPTDGQTAEVLTGSADQQRRWDELKKQEKGSAASVLDGVAMAAPALALAGKLGARSGKFGVETQLPAGDGPAEQIFRLAYEAGRQGIDLEGAVRALAREHAARLAAAEALPGDGAFGTVSG